jgi:MFS family permease
VGKKKKGVGMKRVHLFVLSTWFLGNLSIHFVTPYLPQIALLPHANIHLAQMLISSFLFGKAISMLFWGVFSERYGRRPFMLLSLFLFVVSSWSMSLEDHIYGMIFFRFIQGMSVGGTLLMGRTMINDTSKSPIRSFGYLFTAAGVIIPTLPLLGAFMAASISYQSMFRLVSLYPLMLLCVMAVFLPETNQTKNANRLSVLTVAKDFYDVSKNTLFLSCLFISALMMAGESAFNTSASFILLKNLHLSKQQYGLFITTLGLAHLLGTFSCARCVKRFNLPKLIGTGVVCLALSSALMGMMSYRESISHFLLPMVIYYFGTGFIVATTLAATVKPFPQKKATALGFSLFLQALISGTFSFLTSSIGIHTIRALALVLLATSSIAYYLYLTRIRSSRVLINA